ILKTPDAATVNAGDPIGFTILVANPGAGTATGVTVNDPLPAGSGSGLAWSIGSQSNAGLCSLNSPTPPQTLSCGPTTLASLATFSVHITATTSAAECTLYANTAGVTTTNDGSDISTATITCHPANVTITKTADAAIVNAGDPIGFTVVVSNTGAGAATGVNLTDNLPAGNVLTPVHWSIDGSTGNPAAFSISGLDGSQTLSLAGQPISLAAGASLSVHVTAPTTAQNCATYNNTASVSAGNDGSPTSSASEKALCASITITKTHDAPSISAGTPIGFTVVVSNTGAGTATGVNLTDNLPAGNVLTPVHWSIDGSTGNPLAFSISGLDGSQTLSLVGQPISLGPGASLTVHITAPTNAQNCAAYNNTASVSAGNDGSPTSSASETVLCASITISKSADAATVSAGTPIGFTVVVSNTGAGTATGVNLTDNLPAGNVLTPVRWSIDGSTGNPLAYSISGLDGSQTLSLAGEPIS